MTSLVSGGSTILKAWGITMVTMARHCGMPRERALVTGASGFIGSHLVEELLRRNVSVRALVRKSGDRRWSPV